MAKREPLAGWAPTPNGRYHVLVHNGLELWVTDEGYEVDVSGREDGEASDRGAAQLAAEDAARALVADMAKALGGTVAWSTEGEPTDV